MYLQLELQRSIAICSLLLGSEICSDLALQWPKQMDHYNTKRTAHVQKCTETIVGCAYKSRFLKHNKAVVIADRR